MHSVCWWMPRSREEAFLKIIYQFYTFVHQIYVLLKLGVIYIIDNVLSPYLMYATYWIWLRYILRHLSIFTFRNRDIRLIVTKFVQLCKFVVWNTDIGILPCTVEYRSRWSCIPFTLVPWTGFCCVYWKCILMQLPL